MSRGALLFIAVLLSLLCACLPADARRSEVQVEESLAMQRIDALEAKVDALNENFKHLASVIASVDHGRHDLPHLEQLNHDNSQHRAARAGQKNTFTWILFAHEVWIFMQHANVLLNPYLQRLDRKYGIALLRKRFYWVIAGVLSAYWAREVLSMMLCYSYVSDATKTMIMMSCIYHIAKVIKSFDSDEFNDTLQRLGIMSLLIDQWHLDSLVVIHSLDVDALITLKRVLLQIVLDMISKDKELLSFAVFIAAVWFVHALACQSVEMVTLEILMTKQNEIVTKMICVDGADVPVVVTKKSTATLFVETFKAVIYGQTHDDKFAPKWKNEDDCESKLGMFDSMREFSSNCMSVPINDSIIFAVFALGSMISLSALFASFFSSLSTFNLFCALALSSALVVSAYESMQRLGLSFLPPQALVQGWLVPASGAISGDVVFLAHPTTLSSAFALFVYSIIWMLLSPRVCLPYLYMDDFSFSGCRNSVWLSRLFGWQFISFPRRAHDNICEILREADRLGYKVLGLGALNKAEFVNKSGEELVREVNPKTTKALNQVVHGNTLTAAVVVENVIELFRQSEQSCEMRREVFLTGPTSKDSMSLATLHLPQGSIRYARSLQDGVFCRVWVVGKYDLGVREHIPRDGIAVVFSVPCPLTGNVLSVESAMNSRYIRERKDVTVIDGGLLRMQPERCSKRSFSILLPEHEVYACHAAAMVHANMGWDEHEVGEVDLSKLPVVLHAAKAMGFEIPRHDHSLYLNKLRPSLSGGACAADHSGDASRTVHVGCIIVGAGASGLAAAACLVKRGVEDILIFEQKDKIEGHWNSQYDELNITSRRQHCQLPHYNISNLLPRDLSARDFIHYLHCYSARFSLNISLRTRVVSARRVPQSCRWLVEVEVLSEGGTGQAKGGQNEPEQAQEPRSERKVFIAEHLIIASGLHAVPCFPPNTKELVAGFEGEVHHSSSVKSMQSLAGKHVLIVGMGNSAADIAMSLLPRARSVSLSVRSVPPIVRREWGPLAVEWVSRLCLQHLPPALADAVVDLFIVVNFGRAWWTPFFPVGARKWRPFGARRVPIIDKWAGRQGGGLVDSIKKGALRVHGPLMQARGRHVLVSTRACESSETELVPCDVIVFSTGFQDNLGDWLLIDPHGARQQQTLHKIGFEHGRALLPLKEISEQAKRIARLIASARAQ
ncbi:hypothetical protein GUITHDRAFT_163647 [Guillardia theta CCMP2712]|uniref:Flavin-containing monooxygenase n=1 Tax=Guillardia theta (strain CCMP2712) TaxID=905079 RepID=L1J6G4_GUITC|nr:hypothetical protein GUITHDRAFT_163647 [Guillardia theta CCMP2712]EKX44111.1 hypothetical protein GUITHDRAFT_163647 [Guillardia theta CCMP2712]|eukprot:XP_005831091.1 hypothetical protein GUITHDRAFT_163647 [Guillardia theta CCMP2712]